MDYLFPDGSDPIGKVVRFNSIPFRVVGVLQKKGYNSMGMDQDDLVLAPYTTVMKRILAQTYLAESYVLPLPRKHLSRLRIRFRKFSAATTS